VVVFKDLQKLIEQSQKEQERNLNNNDFERLQGKPFWIWNIKYHKQEDIDTKGDCCFNHIIGLPTKGKMEKPIFDYEKLLYDSLFNIEYYNPLHSSFKNFFVQNGGVLLQDNKDENYTRNCINMAFDLLYLT
jgi:hypothetical protein